MALADDVTDRIEDQVLIELTNPDSRTATTINTTLLALAVTDVESAFTLYGETTYDSTEGTHVLLGVQGVIAVLEPYTRLGHLGGESWDAFLAALDRLRLTSSRARITPQTDSPMTRTSRTISENDPAPPFDWPNFRKTQPRSRDANYDEDDEL